MQQRIILLFFGKIFQETLDETKVERTLLMPGGIALYNLLWFLLVLFALFFVIYNTHVKMDITYKREDNNDIVIIFVSAFLGIIKYRLELPFLDFVKRIDSFAVRFRIRLSSGKEIGDRLELRRAESLDEFIDSINNLAGLYHANEKNIDYVIDKTNIYNFNLYIKYGFEDAYLTGISYGVFYVLIANLLIMLKNRLYLQVKSLILKPIFNKDMFDLKLNCIIDIKIGHIITALKMFIKTSRGSEIDGATYSRSYENNYGKY